MKITPERIEEIEAAAKTMTQLMYQIQGSRKVSIGSPHNVYSAQLDRRKMDRLARQIETAIPELLAERRERDKAIETLREERRLRRQAEAERDALRKQIENKKASDQ